jgi:uncharacterized protein YxeA
MKAIVFVLVLIVVGVVSLGFYLGWFHFSSGSDGSNAHVTVSVDTDQIHEDADKAVDKVQDLELRAKDKVVTATENSGK